MLAIILGFFGTVSGQATLAGILIWGLGLLSKSVVYTKVREALGRASEAAGVGVSAIGNTKLKLVWDPIETVFTDFLFFAIEQFAVGLRKDNVDKMGEQLDRLKSVGSESRANALEEKIIMLETIPPPPESHSDAVVLAAAVAFSESAATDRLKD